MAGFEPTHRTWATAITGASSNDWLAAMRRYVLAIAAGNLVWETAQLPLYTIWYEGTAGEIAFAILHCTGGDIVIAGTTLLGALMLVGDRRWPHSRFGGVAAAAVAGGVAYTIFSEWLNTEIRGSWAYTELMPELPLIGTGISPLVQWFVVPSAAFWWLRRRWRGAQASPLGEPS